MTVEEKVATAQIADVIFNSSEEIKEICFMPADIGLTNGEYELEYVLRTGTQEKM
jgi:hypothetical protein